MHDLLTEHLNKKELIKMLMLKLQLQLLKCFCLFDLNNPNKWQDNVPAKTGYYTQHEHTNNYYRPLSAIQAGQATSNHDFHGYLLF